MLSVEDKQDFQGSNEFWVGFVVTFVEMIEHVEEIFNIAQVLSWHIVLSTNSVSIRIGSNGWHQTQKSVNLFVSGEDIFIDLFSTQSWISLWLES